MADDPVYLNRRGLYISRSRIVTEGTAYSVRHVGLIADFRPLSAD
jgi:hypothetical protein